MPYLTPRSHLPALIEAAREAAASDAFPCILSIPTFISDDLDAARSAARYNLAFFALLPNYRRQWRRAGYGVVMDNIKASPDLSRRELVELIPDDLIDDVCVVGDVADCQRTLQSFRDAGASMPVIAVSPVNEDRLSATNKAIALLGATSER